MANYVYLNNITRLEGTPYTDQDIIFNNQTLNNLSIIPHLIYSLVNASHAPKYVAGFEIVSTNLSGNTAEIKVGPGLCVLEKELLVTSQYYTLDYEIPVTADQTGSLILCISYKKNDDNVPILKLFYVSYYGHIDPTDFFKHSESNLILGVFKFDRNDTNPSQIDSVRCVNDQWMGHPIEILGLDYFLHGDSVPNTLLTGTSRADNYPNYLKYKIQSGRNIRVSPRYHDGDEFLRIELENPDNIKLEFQNPQYYTPATVPGLVSGNRLSCHLKGIDNELGNLDSQIAVLQSEVTNINDWYCEIFTLTTAQVTNGFVDLANGIDPSYVNRALMIVGNAIPQRSGVDFTVQIYNGAYRRINWSTYQLYNILQPGDKIAVYYVHVD